MPNSCSVSGCTASSVNDLGSSRSFHRFPTDAKLRDAWTIRVGRKNFTPSSSSCVCSFHFTTDDFSAPRKDTVPGLRKKTLKKGAIPSQNLQGEAVDTQCFKGRPKILKKAIINRTKEQQNLTPITQRVDGNKNELLNFFANINFQYHCDPISKQKAQDGKSAVCSMHVKDSDIIRSNCRANLTFGALPVTNLSKKPHVTEEPQKRKMIEKYNPPKKRKQPRISPTYEATNTSYKDLPENLESFLSTVTSLEPFKILSTDQGTSNSSETVVHNDEQPLRTKLIHGAKSSIKYSKNAVTSARSETDATRKSVKSSCSHLAQQVSIMSEPTEVTQPAKMPKTNKFVVKSVSKVPKVFEASNLSYNINPVLKNPASRKCPIIYVGEPVFTDSEDFFNDRTKKKPGDAASKEIVKQESLYDIAKLQSVFLASDSVASEKVTSSGTRLFPNVSHIPLDPEELSGYSVSSSDAQCQDTRMASPLNTIQMVSKPVHSPLAAVPQISQVVRPPAVIPQAKITSSTKTPSAIEAAPSVMTKNESKVLSTTNPSKDQTIVSAVCSSASALLKSSIPLAQSNTSMSAPSRRNMKYILPKPPTSASGSVMILNFYPCGDHK